MVNTRKSSKSSSSNKYSSSKARVIQQLKHGRFQYGRFQHGGALYELNKVISEYRKGKIDITESQLLNILQMIEMEKELIKIKNTQKKLSEMLKVKLRKINNDSKKENERIKAAKVIQKKYLDWYYKPTTKTGSPGLHYKTTKREFPQFFKSK